MDSIFQSPIFTTGKRINMKGLLTLMMGILLALCTRAGTVDTLTVYSNSMKKEIKTVVIRPDKYKKLSSLPVVYLLHGWSGNYRGWIKDAPQLAKKADELQLLIVCPDAGFNSWYFDSPVDSTVRYETFVINELVPYIDQHYKTIPDRAFRAIAGLSMGGHGAMYLSIRHKNLFANAGSMAGGVDIRPFPKNWDLSKKLGDSATHPQNWEAYTVINVADQLQPGELNLIIDCGINDFFLPVNRAFHQKLLQKKVEHDYIERPGGHNGKYWGSAVDYQLLFFKKAFDKAAVPVK